MAPKSSPRAIAKVIYKPSTQSTDEYTVVVNIDEVRVLLACDVSMFVCSCCTFTVQPLESRRYVHSSIV